MTDNSLYKHTTDLKTKQEIIQELLPKLKLVDSNKLLSRVKRFTNSSVIQSFAGSLPPVESHIETEINSKELLATTEWIEGSQQDQDDLVKDDVKRLEHWVYKKKLHQTNDTDYRKTLRALISKQIASTGEELFNSEEMKSKILEIITQQLQVQQDLEKLRSKRNLTLLSELAATAQGESAIKALKEFQESTEATKQGAGRLRKIDNELATELQTLRMRKELMDRKKEQKSLLEQNSKLLVTIDDEKMNMERQFIKPKMQPKSDSLNLSTSRSKTNSGRYKSKKGTSGPVQDTHNKHFEAIKEKERRQSIVLSCEKSIEKCKNEYEANLKRIHTLEYEMSQIHPEIDANIKKQIDYYYALLEEGRDTRGMGLTWVVKTLWYLEKKFPAPARFPCFLDEDIVTCILKLAALEIQRDKCDGDLKHINVLKRKESMRFVLAFDRSEDTSLTGDTQPKASKYTLLSSNHKKIPMLFPRNPSSTTLKQTKDPKELMIEDRATKLQKEARELKKSELSRIAKRFIKDTLQGKPGNSHITETISALVGEEEGIKTYARILQKREEIRKSWEKYVSFVFVKPIKKKRRRAFNFTLKTKDELPEDPLMGHVKNKPSRVPSLPRVLV